jgi:hypothetical protein
MAKPSTQRSTLICFRSRLTPKTPRSIASTASQWDSYAGPEGHCLVFDIAEVARMLWQEGHARYWAWLMLEPVRYADRPADEIFPELVHSLADTLQQFLNGVRVPEMAVPQFLAGTTLLKGATYKSEREVRIVAVPGTAQVGEARGQRTPGPIRRDRAAARD